MAITKEIKTLQTKLAKLQSTMDSSLNKKLPKQCNLRPVIYLTIVNSLILLGLLTLTIKGM